MICSECIYNKDYTDSIVQQNLWLHQQIDSQRQRLKVVDNVLVKFKKIMESMNELDEYLDRNHI
jgi:hypothetical protein